MNNQENNNVTGNNNTIGNNNSIKVTSNENKIFKKPTNFLSKVAEFFKLFINLLKFF